MRRPLSVAHQPPEDRGPGRQPCGAGWAEESIRHIHIFVYNHLPGGKKETTMQFQALVLRVEMFPELWHELVF